MQQGVAFLLRRVADQARASADLRHEGVGRPVGGPNNDVVPLVGHNLEFWELPQAQLLVPLERHDEERDILPLHPVVEGRDVETPEVGDPSPKEGQIVPCEFREAHIEVQSPLEPLLHRLRRAMGDVVGQDPPGELLVLHHRCFDKSNEGGVCPIPGSLETEPEYASEEGERESDQKADGGWAPPPRRAGLLVGEGVEEPANLLAHLLWGRVGPEGLQVRLMKGPLEICETLAIGTRRVVALQFGSLLFRELSVEVLKELQMSCITDQLSSWVSPSRWWLLEERT